MSVPWYASLGSEDNLQELVLSFNCVKLRESNLGHCPWSVPLFLLEPGITSPEYWPSMLPLRYILHK